MSRPNSPCTQLQREPAKKRGPSFVPGDLRHTPCTGPGRAPGTHVQTSVQGTRRAHCAAGAMGEVQSVCISGSKDNQGTRMQAATHPAHRVPGPIRAPVNASRSAERLPTPPPLGPPAAGPEKPVQLTAEKSVSFGHRYETHYTTERADSGASGIVDVGFPALNSQHIAGLSGFMSVPPSPERPKASGSTTLPGHWHSPQKQVPGIARAQGSAPFALPPTDEPKLHSLPLSQSPPAVSPGPQVAIGVQRSGAQKYLMYVPNCIAGDRE